MLFNLLVLASTAAATCTHGLFRRSGEDGTGNTFGYGALDGPMNWVSLSPANAACKTGMHQSPINLDKSINTTNSKPTMDVPAGQNATFQNLGTTIQATVNGTTTYNDVQYRLVQFHMHTPSEHYIDGEYHPLELHIVHQSVTNPADLLVIGVMFEVSAGPCSSPILKAISPYLPMISTPGTSVSVGDIDFSDLQRNILSSPLIQYSGSLTTPPCTEGVTFLILKELLPVSVADFNAIKKIIKFNARFIQNTLGQMNILGVVELSGGDQKILPMTVGHH